MDKRKCLLVVDDDQTTLELFKMIFAGNDFEVITAASGEEAIHQYVLHKGQIKVGLIDLLLPEMNGLEVIDKIREDLKIVGDEIFFVVVTADLLSHMYLRAKSEHVVIDKPFEMKLLKNLVLRHMC
ncbi:MAG TPA: response regulator [Candidatus Magasanikbacteria bacterium]|nr:response regulator [Candidatus Magasanikbacteria bacterium]